MRSVFLAVAVLMSFAMLPSGSAAEVTPPIDQVDLPMAFGDCWECHICSTDDDLNEMSSEGAATYRSDIYKSECVDVEECGGCAGEEQDQDAELALTDLIESDGENVLSWMEEYQDDFALTMVGTTLQVSRKCGQAITWLALGDAVLASATELLEQ